MRSRPLAILGAGRSGRAAAALARKRGRTFEVFAEEGLPAAEREAWAGIGGEVRRELPADLAREWVVSPGFPVDHPWCVAVREGGGVLIPELEFGWRELSGEVLAVTGSLGKTSMVLLAEQLIRASGRSVTVSGNIGIPVSETACTCPHAEVHVIEASSFQLETARTFAPDRAVCLNLVPNHLDRHPGLAAYARAKATLFRTMPAGGTACWPEDFPVEVSTDARRVSPGAVALPGLADTPFAQGPLRRNLEMLLAAMAGMTGMDPLRLEPVIRGFRFPEHRLRSLPIPGAGRVIDDSKSTCLSATRAALESVPGTVHLVMGGLDKHEDFGLLTPVFRQRNPRLYLFGAAAKKMEAAWQDSVDVCVRGDSLADVMAVLPAYRTSGTETLCFSPGCASFDQYDGFHARGLHFQELVRGLADQFPLR